MLKKSLFSAFIGLCFSGSVLAAMDFYVVVPVKGKQGASVPSQSISVTLNAATLPFAEVGKAYSYNLRDHLQVTGDSALDLSQAVLSTSDTLPAGLSLAANGVLSGTPTVKNEAGSSFQVLATYKSKTGQQVYTIVVNGVTLNVTQISAGGYHTCGVTTSGGLKCWGLDSYGQLGNVTSVISNPAPVDVAGLTTGVASVSAGGSHTCAVTTSGGLKCWGLDSDGQVGNDAAKVSQITPVDVAGLTSGVASVSAGGAHTCAVMTSGAVKCWGRDTEGQLGNDATMASSATPVNVLGLGSGVSSVSSGYDHTCALTNSGGVKCWGSDQYGKLGNDASLANQALPVDVQGLTAGVRAIAAGGSHTCAVMTSGGVKCWGGDDYGQLGDDAVVGSKASPVDVSGLSSGVEKLSAGYQHTCAITSSGGLKCWGSDQYGQQGNDATLANRRVPVDVVGITSASSISAGYFHTCALTPEGAKCWGRDDSGQLGNDASLTNQATPVDVTR